MGQQLTGGRRKVMTLADPGWEETLLDQTTSTGLVCITGDDGIVCLDSGTLFFHHEIPSSYDCSLCRIVKLDEDKIAVTMSGILPFGPLGTFGDVPPHIHVFNPFTCELELSIDLGMADRRLAVFGLAVVPACCAFDSSRLISGLSSGVVVWDAETGLSVCTLPEPPENTFMIKHVDEWNDEVFLAGADDFAIRRYDVLRGSLLQRIAGHTASVWGLEADDRRGILFSVGWDKQVRLASRDSFECFATLSLSDVSSSILYVADTHTLLVATWAQGEIEVWDVRKSSRRRRILKPRDIPLRYVRSMARVDQNVIVSASERAVAWDYREGKLLKNLKTRQSWHHDVCTVGSRFDSPGKVEFPQSNQMDERFEFLNTAGSKTFRVSFGVSHLDFLMAWSSLIERV